MPSKKRERVEQETRYHQHNQGSPVGWKPVFVPLQTEEIRLGIRLTGWSQTNLQCLPVKFYTLGTAYVHASRTCILRENEWVQRALSCGESHPLSLFFRQKNGVVTTDMETQLTHSRETPPRNTWLEHQLFTDLYTRKIKQHGDWRSLGTSHGKMG